MNVILFTGPTLSPAEASEVIDAECLPPVSQGDVYRAALRRPRAIGIIDGYFERVPSVWHKEILWAMSQGIHVFGSASMGALRAAELAPFGMIGVGAVFAAYRDGVLEDDDEVAVAHGPTADSYQYSSEAMVNIRATLAAALAAAVIQADTCAALLGLAKRLFYANRSWPRVFEQASSEPSLSVELDALRRWLPGGRVNQKREDALAMLGAMKRLLDADPPPLRVTFVLEETLHWEESVALSREFRFEDDTDFLVLEELARDPDAFARAQAAALGWMLAEDRARRQARLPEAAAMLEFSREFCRRHGLDGPREVTDWLQHNHCSADDLQRLLVLYGCATRARDLAPNRLAACLLAYLRWTGDYTSLRGRARPVNAPSTPPHPTTSVPG